MLKKITVKEARSLIKKAYAIHGDYPIGLSSDIEEFLLSLRITNPKINIRDNCLIVDYRESYSNIVFKGIRLLLLSPMRL